MNLEVLERFVMDTIDVIFTNPDEYEAEAVKSTVAYRFELHRQSLKRGKQEDPLSDLPPFEIHFLSKDRLKIPTPTIHTISKKEITSFATNSAKEDGA